MRKLKLFWCYYKHHWFNEMFQKFEVKHYETPPNIFHKEIDIHSVSDYKFYLELILFKNNPDSFMKEIYENSIIKNLQKERENKNLIH